MYLDNHTLLELPLTDGLNRLAYLVLIVGNNLALGSCLVELGKTELAARGVAEEGVDAGDLNREGLGGLIVRKHHRVKDARAVVFLLVPGLLDDKESLEHIVTLLRLGEPKLLNLYVVAVWRRGRASVAATLASFG